MDRLLFPAASLEGRAAFSRRSSDESQDHKRDSDSAAIGTGEAFDRGRDFGAWLGLVPRQHSTGGRSVLGRISKRGSKYLRTLLIQAARVLLMRPHNWPRFSFGGWLQTASERLHRNKLAVALANKLARIAWSVLRNDKAFDTHLEVAAI
jgi:transposase